jgi:hypothetical protein
MKRSILSTLLLFFVALDFAGTRTLAIVIAPTEVAEGDLASEERDQQILKSRRSQDRSKKSQRPFITISSFIRSASDLARAALRSRPFLQSDFSPDNSQLLQVFRI